MRLRSLIATLTLVSAPTLAFGASLDYTLSVDADAGTVRVDFELAGFPYETCTFSLGTPAAPAEDYFAYFDAIEFRDDADTVLEPSRSGLGVMVVAAPRGTLRGSYTVLVSEMNETLGVGPRMPVVGTDFAILPIESLLGLPGEVEDRGVELKPLSIGFERPDGWRTLTPWSTYGGRASHYENVADEVRNAIVCLGDFDVRNDLQTTLPALHLTRLHDDAVTARFLEKVTTIIGYFESLLGTAGDPIVVVATAADSPDEAETRGYGRYVRVVVPPLFALAEAAETTVGTEAYAFHHRLAHEIYHHWIGVRGMLRPLQAESYWVVEGSADYFAAMALDQTGLAAKDSFLAFLGERSSRLREREDRAEPIDRDTEAYESDRGYRSLLLAKAPLVCFLLDTQLITARKTGNSLTSVLRNLFYGAFLKKQSGDMAFGMADLSERVESVIGMRGRILIGNYTRSDLFPILEKEALEVDLTWDESGDEIEVGWGKEEGAIFQRSFPPKRSRS